MAGKKVFLVWQYGHEGAYDPTVFGIFSSRDDARIVKNYYGRRFYIQERIIDDTMFNACINAFSQRKKKKEDVV